MISNNKPFCEKKKTFAQELFKSVGSSTENYRSWNDGQYQTFFAVVYSNSVNHVST